MKKAFLSHNSADKLYVESVANRLSRDKIIFDKFIFEEAVDFREAIQKGLNESDLFVLFASKESLKAPWVKYELDEAELRLLNGEMKNILIFLIGDVKFDDLPQWCKKKKIILASTANNTARIIQSNLLKVVDQKEVFIGRENEMSAFTKHLFSSSFSAQVLVFVGLEGQGRRTFAKNVLAHNFNLELGPIYEYSKDSTLVDLYIQLLYEEVDEMKKDFLEKAIKVFETSSIESKISEIIRILSIFKEYRMAPVILDKGGLVNSNGQYHDEFMKLIEEVNKIPQLYLVLIQTRNPYGYGKSQPFFVTYVGEVSKSNMELLVFTLLRNMDSFNTREEIKELAEYLDGYPPAAYYATSLVHHKGMSLLLRDKRILTEFKVGIFTSFLKDIIGEDINKQNILKILGSMSPMPYSIIETIIVLPNYELEDIMNEFIDNSIVYSLSGKYALATPLRDSVRALWGHLEGRDYKEMAIKLKKKFWDVESLPDPIILDILIVMLLRAELDEELKEFSGVILPTSVLKAAKDAYANNEWELTKNLCLRVLELDNSRNEAKVILIKSFIRLNEHNEADKILRELHESSHPQYHALRGFKFLKRREYEQAIYEYKKAITNGDTSKSVYRGIAECYYWCGEYSQAESYISNALNGKAKPNKFIVDLAAKIAIEKEDFNQAEDLIKILEVVDRSENVSHRRAVLLSKQEDWEKALEYAEQACLRQPPLPEMFLTKAHIEIVLKETEKADKTLAHIIDIFNDYEKKDTYIGLKIKLNIAKENWVLAEQYLNKLQKKGEKYQKLFKLQILKLKVLDKSIPLYEKRIFEEEIKSLENEYENGEGTKLEIKFYEQN